MGRTHSNTISWFARGWLLAVKIHKCGYLLCDFEFYSTKCDMIQEFNSIRVFVAREPDFHQWIGLCFDSDISGFLHTIGFTDSLLTENGYYIDRPLLLSRMIRFSTQSTVNTSFWQVAYNNLCSFSQHGLTTQILKPTRSHIKLILSDKKRTIPSRE